MTASSHHIPINTRITFENDPLKWLEALDFVIAPQQKRSRRTLEQIIVAAMRLFVDRGFDQTTIADIARYSDVSVGSIYQRFSDKSAILQTIVAGYRNTRIKEIQELGDKTRGSHHDAREVVEFHIDVIFSALSGDKGILRLIETQRLTDEKTYFMLVEANEQVSMLIFDLLKEHLPDRDARELEAQVRYLHNIVRGSAVWTILPRFPAAPRSLDINDPRYRAEALVMALAYLDI
ncbi:MAG: helix-turn-helix domain-containing protein [Sphingobium sp.]|nr:helix-turn-helix domain-containing protein [Sphingobium sp.]